MINEFKKISGVINSSTVKMIATSVLGRKESKRTYDQFNESTTLCLEYLKNINDNVLNNSEFLEAVADIFEALISIYQTLKEYANSQLLDCRPEQTQEKDEATSLIEYYDEQIFEYKKSSDQFRNSIFNIDMFVKSISYHVVQFNTIFPDLMDYVEITGNMKEQFDKAQNQKNKSEDNCYVQMSSIGLSKYITSLSVLFDSILKTVIIGKKIFSKEMVDDFEDTTTSLLTGKESQIQTMISTVSISENTADKINAETAPRKFIKYLKCVVHNGHNPKSRQKE